MSKLIFSLTILENLTNKEYLHLLKKSEDFFLRRGLKLKNIKRKEGTTTLEGILTLIQDPDTLKAIAIIGSGITLIIMKLFGISIKKFLKKENNSNNHQYSETKNKEKQIELVHTNSEKPISVNNIPIGFNKINNYIEYINNEIVGDKNNFAECSLEISKEVARLTNTKIIEEKFIIRKLKEPEGFECISSKKEEETKQIKILGKNYKNLKLRK